MGHIKGHSGLYLYMQSQLPPPLLDSFALVVQVGSLSSCPLSWAYAFAVIA